MVQGITFIQIVSHENCVVKMPEVGEMSLTIDGELSIGNFLRGIQTEPWEMWDE